MIYGTKLIYKYSEEVPKVNINGETMVDKDGNFLTEEKEKKLELTFSAITFLIYKNFTAREFMKDFMVLGLEAQKEFDKNKEVFEKAQNNIENLTEEDIEVLSKIGFNESIEFFINATAAMIATTEYPRKRDFVEIINELPMYIFQDEQFMKELVQLISFSVKKNSRL